MRCLFLYRNSISDITPLENLTQLKSLSLWQNQVSDLTPLINLTNLEDINLKNNRISDISPLIENLGIGKGDELNIKGNRLNLSRGSQDLENIQILEERGVSVSY